MASDSGSCSSNAVVIFSIFCPLANTSIATGLVRTYERRHSSSSSQSISMTQRFEIWSYWAFHVVFLYRSIERTWVWHNLTCILELRPVNLKILDKIKKLGTVQQLVRPRPLLCWYLSSVQLYLFPCPNPELYPINWWLNKRISPTQSRCLKQHGRHLGNKKKERYRRQNPIL